MTFTPIQRIPSLGSSLCAPSRNRDDTKNGESHFRAIAPLKATSNVTLVRGCLLSTQYYIKGALLSNSYYCRASCLIFGLHSKHRAFSVFLFQNVEASYPVVLSSPQGAPSTTCLAIKIAKTSVKVHVDLGTVAVGCTRNDHTTFRTCEIPPIRKDRCHIPPIIARLSWKVSIPSRPSYPPGSAKFYIT